MNQINNDNIRQGSKIVYGNDNIHSFMCMAGEKVGNLFLYMNSFLQHDSCNGISKRIMDCNAFTFAWATQEMGTQIIDGVTTLTLLKLCNCTMRYIEMNMECCTKMGGGQTN